MIAGIKTNISIGGHKIERCPLLLISMGRRTFISRAYITIPDASGELEGIFQDGDPVSLEYGYRGDMTGQWIGTVAGTMRMKKDQLTILASGQELRLCTTRIKETYLEESAAAIARHMIKQTGLAVGRIEIPNDIIARFPVANLPVTGAVRQLLHTLEKAFGQDMSDVDLWVGADGTVNLGNFDEPGSVPVIATGETLIEHLPSKDAHGLSKIEAFLLPALLHSQRFRLKDTRLGIDAKFRGQRVMHVIKPNQVRTFIEFGDEYARY